MKIFVIAFFKEGVFHHGIVDCDGADTRKHYEMLKQTRNAKTIPEMNLYELELNTPIETHIKAS